MNISSSEDAPVGAIFLATINGWTGRWVAGAQAFVRGGSRYTHAGLILSSDQVIEAEPGGAVIRPSLILRERKNLLVSDAPVQWWKRSTVFPQILGEPEASERQMRQRIDATARALEGTPYSLLDYYTLAAVEFGWPGGSWARKRVEDSKHLICSALTDRVLDVAGVHLYSDGRLPGDVTPGDLADWIEEHE
jgi:hypothetical protein